MFRWIVYSLAGLGGLVVIVLLIGWSVPVGHVASRTRVLSAPPEAVFATITDFARYPEWRSGVRRVEVSGAPGAGQMVRELGSTGEIPYRVEVFEPPSRLVMRIAGENMPFGGTWTYEVRPSGTGGSEITMTEDGEVYNLFFRFMARFVFGYHATMDQFLADLAAHRQ